MSIPFQPRERPTSEWTRESVAVPGAWPTVTEVHFEPSQADLSPYGWTNVRYEFWRDTPWSDPLLALDSRRRGLVEAFSAIRTPTVWKPTGQPVAEQGDVEAFVKAFGPVWPNGVDLEMLPSMIDHSHMRDADGRHLGQVPPTDTLEQIGTEVDSLRRTISELDALAQDDQVLLAELNPRPGHRNQMDEWVADDVKAYSRRMLADWFTSRLSTLRLILVNDPHGRFGLVVRPGSLLDLIYWQLSEHIRRRPVRMAGDRPDPVFRTPRCEWCGGAILATRLDDDWINRWHSGCKAAGQARARRRRIKGSG